MKELSIEQKTKAYDEALKWMCDLYPNLGIAAKEKAESIFPELRGSEDEKVKKEITELVMQPTWKTEKEFYRRKELVDWVEKQGKQKLALSEEDEEIRKWIINEIKIKHHNLDEDNVDFVDKAIAWLEKQYKETSWKPSKEEMDVLYGLAYITNQYDEHKEEVITRLYQDLKREFFNSSSYENMFPNTQDGVRRRSTIQVLEYARSLDNYNQYGKADIDKNIAWLEKQGKVVNEICKENDDSLTNEDEKIRKELIEFLVGKRIISNDLEGVNIDKTLTWLEKQGESDEIKIKKFLINKGYPIDTNGIFPTYEEMYNIIREGLEEQGEQKPVDNVSANFKVKGGKWYVCTQTFVLRGKVVIIKGQTYQAEKDNVIKGENGCRFIDRHDGNASDYFRPWTIQDAKDGNVLAEEKIDGYLSPFVALYKKIDEECDFESYCFIGFDGKFYKGENGHSTEEIHPATKEQRDLLFQKMKEEGYEWDDDKKVLIKKIEEKNLTDFENAMMHIGESFFGKNAGLEPNDTNTIKEQAKLLLELTNTHKWSEDDEKLTNRIEGWLDTLCDYLKDNSPEYIEDVKNTIEQLKSLKERYFWKPKTWEIQILESVIEKGENPKNYSATLHSILEQLKKLKG